MKFWHKIEDDLFVIKSDGLEDFRAVIGSKTSRAADLDIKADIDREGVEKFLTMNLAGYGHASIGEMSFPSVHHRGLGWIGAWLVEDDPLFVGQEVSTRAVDVSKMPDGRMVCYDAPSGLEGQNDFFWQLFQELDSKNEQRKGYKFDGIRWAMPGTARSGVTLMMNARAAIRHLERLESLEFMKNCVNKFMKGIKECTPFVFNALRKGPRRAHERWLRIEEIERSAGSLDFNNSIEIIPPSDLRSAMQAVEHIAPKGEKEHLDPEFKALGLFKIKIYCSIASARDWHRHRPAMPWKVRLVKDQWAPYIAPWYEIGENEGEVRKAIKEGYELTRDIKGMQRLYSLPYGTTILLEGLVALPELLYMLELRANASGSNFEYALQAKEGLKSLSQILGKKFSDKHIRNN